MLFGAWLLAACSSNDDVHRGTPGTKLPALSLAALADGTVAPVSAPERAVLVNVWASWCAPCRREMPSLDALSRMLDPRDIAVIGINVDDDRYLALEFIRTQPLAFAQFADPGMRAVREQWQVRALPETLIIAADGRLLARVSGARDWLSTDSRRLIAEALARVAPAS